ncbi:hypothetical protein DV532_15710 [Pseudomonas sp. Leaf58]|nr:hypothetical protein DV532_15710 [Pseudomonas sp. Leaf58]
MDRILTNHPAEGSLAKLMLLIGFGYNRGLLIEESVVGAGLPANRPTRWMARASPVFAGKPAATTLGVAWMNQRVTVRMVTNSSAAVGCTPMVSSNCCLVAPAFKATPRP